MHVVMLMNRILADVVCCITGFGCFKTYFESVNKNDHRLKKDNTGQQVSKVIIFMSPRKGRGIYCFWCGSCWRRRWPWRRRQRDTFLFAIYLMNRWVDFN